MRKWQHAFGAIGLLLVMATAPVLAGALYIAEFGDPSMGASGAGAGALAQDASTAFHNPAGIMSLEPGENHWLVSALYVDPSIKFSKESGSTVAPLAPGAGNGGEAGVSAVGGGFWWARPLNEKFGLGVSLNSVAAAAIDYQSGNANGNDFVGRYWATQVDLLTITLMPSAAWRINDQWSVGFGVPIQLGRLDLDVSVPAPGSLLPPLPGTDGVAKISSGEDVTAAIQLSLLWEATQRLRFGLTYMSENELNFDGDLSVTGPGGNPLPLPINSADVTIPFVQTLRLHGASDLGDRLTLMATVAWEDWSSFENLLVSTDVGTGALVRDWKDTWKFAVGLRWRTDGPWTHYTGIAYDTSPTSASKRTADMPMDEQLRLSVGTNYTLKGGTTLGGAITYADYGDARIDNGGNWGQVVGKYSTNSVVFVSLNVGW
jgi:long-chain fatty acid transport protein